MCLYVEKIHPAITANDICAFKIIIKGEDEKFHPYFDVKCEIEFDKLLINDEKIHTSITELQFPYKHYVSSGVFHSFIDLTQVLRILKNHPDKDNMYICDAIIPKGTEYFIGFSHSFSLAVEKTYGSHKIIYKNPRKLTNCLDSHI